MRKTDEQSQVGDKVHAYSRNGTRRDGVVRRTMPELFLVNVAWEDESMPSCWMDDMDVFSDTANVPAQRTPGRTTEED